MISYYFPPTGGPCVQRTLYFTKYLRHWNYEPLVVHSAVVPYGFPEDSSLLAELPGDTRRFSRGISGPAGAVDLAASWLAGRGRIGRGLAWRLVAGFNWCTAGVSPDPYVFWANGLLKPLIRLVKKHGIDVLYSTSCPYSDHYLALKIKNETGIPWVADFRDLWTQDKAYVPTPGWRWRRDKCLEQAVLRTADIVVHVSPGYAAEMRKLVPSVPPEKFRVIYNGVDLGTQPRTSPAGGSRFVLSYVGNLNTSNWSEALLSAWQLLGQHAGQERVLWRVAGTMSNNVLRKAEELGDQFEFCGYLPHGKARTMMVDSDALLLLINRAPGAHGIVTGKMFEYLGSGRPILCLTPVRGDAADLVTRHRAGIVADSESVPDIYRGLRQLFDAWAAGNPVRGANHEDILAYDRRELTRQLATLFDEVAEGNGSRRTRSVNRGGAQNDVV